MGLKATLKEAGEIAARLSARNRGHKVDPDDPKAGDGTANIGFAHHQSLAAIDRTPFGHHRAQLMHLFSGTLRIAGGDVKLMLDMHCHAFEPCAWRFEHARARTRAREPLQRAGSRR